MDCEGHSLIETVATQVCGLKERGQGRVQACDERVIISIKRHLRPASRAGEIRGSRAACNVNLARSWMDRKSRRRIDVTAAKVGGLQERIDQYRQCGVVVTEAEAVPSAMKFISHSDGVPHALELLTCRWRRK